MNMAAQQKLQHLSLHIMWQVTVGCSHLTDAQAYLKQAGQPLLAPELATEIANALHDLQGPATLQLLKVRQQEASHPPRQQHQQDIHSCTPQQSACTGNSMAAQACCSSAERRGVFRQRLCPWCQPCVTCRSCSKHQHLLHAEPMCVHHGNSGSTQQQLSGHQAHSPGQAEKPAGESSGGCKARWHTCGGRGIRSRGARPSDCA